MKLKTYLFIYLELFCLRFYRKYQPELVKEGYSLIKDFISNALYNDYQDFKRSLSSKSCGLYSPYFNFVQDFLRYIKRFD